MIHRLPEHASRLRIGMAVVALLHPLFWLGRRGIDPREADVEGMRLAIVIGALALVAFSYHPAVRRFEQQALVLGVSLLLIASSWIVVGQGWETQYVIAPIINLASNALKFTAIGGVTITARAEAERIAFVVRDTGRGIPADQQELLFGKLMRLDSRSTARRPGSGSVPVAN